MQDQRPKIVLGENIKRESVLIDPNAPVTTGEDTVNRDNVIAEGESTNEALKHHYGKE